MSKYDFEEIIEQFQKGELPENIIMQDEDNKIFLNKEKHEAFYFDEENDNKTVILKSSNMKQKMFQYIACPECGELHIREEDIERDEIIRCSKCNILYKADIEYAKIY